MYAIDMNTCTAIDIIQRSMTCHPSLFRERLESIEREDLAFTETRDGVTRKAVIAHANATRRACHYVSDNDVALFVGDMGAGIIALNVACNLQCLPAHIRTASALRTWPGA